MPVNGRYKFSAVRRVLRAAQTGNKVSIRIDGPGVLSLNFMVEVEGGRNCFVEFKVRIGGEWG
jgi:cell cycle checkpoint protein